MKRFVDPIGHSHKNSSKGGVEYDIEGASLRNAQYSLLNVMALTKKGLKEKEEQMKEILRRHGHHAYCEEIPQVQCPICLKTGHSTIDCNNCAYCMEEGHFMKVL